jgi:transposase-like protein
MCSWRTHVDPCAVLGVDFWFSAKRDAGAAQRFFQKALRVPGHPRPRVITADGNPS